MTQLMLLPASAIPVKHAVKRRGHAWQPGTGPAGEKCGSCRFIHRKHAAGTYIKCGNPGAPKWTGGPGTDIRVRDPACKFWEAKP